MEFVIDDTPGMVYLIDVVGALTIYCRWLALGELPLATVSIEKHTGDTLMTNEYVNDIDQQDGSHRTAPQRKVRGSRKNQPGFVQIMKAKVRVDRFDLSVPSRVIMYPKGAILSSVPERF